MNEENSTPNQINSQNPIQEDNNSNSPADLYEISSVRTYRGDLGNTVQRDKISSAKVLIAEQNRQETQKLKEDKYSIENNTNKLKLIFSVFFIILAVIAVGYVGFNFLKPKVDTDQKIVFDNSGNLFAIDKTLSFDVLNKTREEVDSFINQSLNSKNKENSINEIVLYQTTYENSEKKQKILNFPSVLKIVGIEFPEILKRSLSNDYIFGTYTINSKNSKFILFKLSDYPNAYDSMLSYESDIIDDIKNFFGGFEEFQKIDQLRSKKIETMSMATTTLDATSSLEQKNKIDEIDSQIIELENKILTYKKFIDIVLQNTDSRAVVNQDSKVLFYYTFIDREWLLMSNDIEVLKEIKRRIREKNLSR